MPKSTEKGIADRVAAIVLAGGQGTRLFPLTQQRCKPAVSFGGKYRLIDIPISNALNSKIHKIFIIAQYYACYLHQHILTTYHQDLLQGGGIELLSPEETPGGKIWFKGTADAVRQNLSHLLKTPAEYFLILSGDQLYNMEFLPMVEFAIDNDADLVIAALPVEEPEAKRMGLLKISPSKRIVDFYEKPQDSEILNFFQLPAPFLENQHNKNLYLGSMGIYIFKRKALIELLKEEGDDFGKQLIPHQVKHGKSFAYLYKGYWEDIGTIKSYYYANLALLSPQKHLETYDENNPIYAYPYHLPNPIIKKTLIHHSLISPGAIVEAKEISRSILGIRTHVHKGSVIRNSILLGNHNVYPPPIHFSIGENCLIENAIVDEETMIGNRVKLINKKKLQKYDGEGIYIRDGIIVVTTGTHLPDGFIL